MEPVAHRDRLFALVNLSTISVSRKGRRPAIDKKQVFEFARRRAGPESPARQFGLSDAGSREIATGTCHADVAAGIVRPM
jgi:hypothetical protein